MDIYEYLDGLQRAIERNRLIVSIEYPVVAQAFDEFRGLFRARVFFWDGSNLTVDEIIDTQAGYPDVLHYSYTYIARSNSHIFRYDNSPHYPHHSTFPHHRHRGAGEIPEPAEQPTLNRVFKEIERILTASQ